MNKKRRVHEYNQGKPQPQPSFRFRSGKYTPPSVLSPMVHTPRYKYYNMRIGWYKRRRL